MRSYRGYNLCAGVRTALRVGLAALLCVCAQAVRKGVHGSPTCARAALHAVIFCATDSLANVVAYMSGGAGGLQILVVHLLFNLVQAACVARCWVNPIMDTVRMVRSVRSCIGRPLCAVGRRVLLVCLLHL